ncbi:MAG TPA: aminotransferase class V-fold PLP-dependent enzyme [Gemmatimonadaceae bacterium]|nr:aminotransferase class V-fold PLP-dependent enzyme [Gemmatimonadaceae bacterium]
MTDRRTFLGSLIGAGLALPLALPSLGAQAGRHVARAIVMGDGRAPARLAEDEAYWGEIQRAFDVDRTLINLNNGGICPAPTHVLEQMIRDLRFSNELPTEHMWRVLEPRVESVRRELATEFGCDAEELAITRNASESQQTMIFGMDLARGDEVILTTQNYPRMLNAWEQRARRDGVVLRKLTLDTPVPSPAYHLRRIADAITPRTRVIEVMHISNQTGQVAPVREIVELARPRGIAVFVDGAHSFAHFPFTRDQLGCDYFGTSLHKWLLAPVGTGFLSVRRDRIPGLWPMMAAAPSQAADIRKFEEVGTHPAANHNAIAAALTFHRSIGADRKIARLRFLRDRWAKRLLEESDRVRMMAPIGPDQGGAIGTVAIAGLDMAKVGSWLLTRHRIVTTPIVSDEMNALRVTPNLYTTLGEIDRFGDAMIEAIRKGIA